MKKLIVVPAVLCLSVAIPVLASPITYTAPAYHVGVEDRTNGDYDYNDGVFTLTGNGLQLLSTGTLSAPIVPGTSGTPFWNHLSADGTGRNFGNCLYTPATNNCTGGGPVDPTALYLSNAGSSVAFDFFSTGTVTYTFNARLAGDTDVLSWCNIGGCSPLSFSGTSTFGPGGEFWFQLQDFSSGHLATFLSTSTSGINNFAASAAAVPEPATVALVGLALLGIGGFRIRRARTAAAK